MIAEALARRLHDRAGHGLRQRLVRIFVLARPFEHVAAGDLLAAQVAGLAGDAAELLEVVVVGLELVIADREILDRHLGRNGVPAVALVQMAAQIVVGRHQPPRRAVPVRARAAERRCRAGTSRAAASAAPSPRANAAASAVSICGVLEQLLAHRVFQIVAHAREREVLARRALGAALEADDVEARLGQFARHDAAGPADADHDRIDFLENGRHVASPYEKSAIDCGGLSYFLPR